MARSYLENIIRHKLSKDPINQDDIRQYYEAHHDAFYSPAARRVALIEIPTREAAAEIRARLLVEIEHSEDGPVNAFRRAAGAYSTDRAVATKGGDIGFVAENPVAHSDEQKAGGSRARISAAVYQLDEPGEVTAVFALDPGWGLATFFEERAAQTVSLKKAAGEIRQTLHQKRRAEAVDAFIAELRAGAEIQIFSEALKAVDAPPTPAPRKASEIALRSEPAFGVKESADSAAGQPGR